MKPMGLDDFVSNMIWADSQVLESKLKNRELSSPGPIA